MSEEPLYCTWYSQNLNPKAGGCSSGVAPHVAGVRYCTWHSFAIPTDNSPPSDDGDWGRCALM